MDSFDYIKYKAAHSSNFTNIILKEDLSMGSKKCIGEVCRGRKRPLYCFDEWHDPEGHPDKWRERCKGCDTIWWIENKLKLYKGRWKGKRFKLFPWQKVVTFDVFGTIKPDGTRQYKEVYIEVPKKNGKSPLVSAYGAKLFFNDHEPGCEIYPAACDIKQASIIFNNMKYMIEQNETLGKKCKIVDSTKRIIHNSQMGSFISVVSADTKTKHGIDVHACLFDELHAQPNRNLYDVMTKGSGDARLQPMFFYVTTAGYDRNSICWEVHQRALRTMQNPENDPSFYAVLFYAEEDDDWTDEKVWLKANPSMPEIISIETVREACEIAKQSPADENFFRRMRLNDWVKQESRYIPMHDWDKSGILFEPENLKKEVFFAGLDLSSNIDLSCYLILCKQDEYYYVIPYFWIPEDNIKKRVDKDKVPYDNWLADGFIEATPGNVIDHKYIETRIIQINTEFEIAESAYDRWGAIRMVQNLTEEGFKLIPFGQGMASMAAPTKELLSIILQHKLCHNNHPVLRWMADNLVVKTDAAGNFKPDKEKSTERIDGIVSMIMAFDRCIRNEYEDGNVYTDYSPIVI